MTLPNKLSTLRICMVPLFIVAYFLPYEWGAYVAVGIFILAAFTDFLDGYIARKYNLVSDLGKLLDPIADKILVCAALFCVVATNPLQYLMYLDMGYQANWIRLDSHLWAADFGVIFLSVGATLIISRELLVSAVRQIAASKGVVVQANVYGKVKTILQDISLPLLILLRGASLSAQDKVSSINLPYDYIPSLFFTVIWWIAVAMFAASIILTVVSGVIYLVQNRKVFTN
ncbi:MAG: CDP-alcohol phosphatidyltransferase family protein [Clostridiales bacterium]|nr:CDP-alcohol phosphatidyltransferase family protein [Clostridiales bacterium]